MHSWGLMTMSDGKQMYKCHSCLKESPVESSPSPEARVDWENLRARVEEEFHIVYQLGLQKNPADFKSAMLNVDNLTQAAFEKGREAR